MNFFKFLQRNAMQGPQNLELLTALKAEKTAPSPDNRSRLIEVLRRSTVLIAVRELPSKLQREGPFVVEEDTYVEKLGSTNAQGERVGLIFSHHKQVQARKKGAPWMAQTCQQAAQHSLSEGQNGIVIDPAGDWVELSRAEVEQLAKDNIENSPSST